ncbi:MAG: ribonuclease III [Cyclobacteriaceae bacterium]
MWNLLSLSKPNKKEDKKLIAAIKTIAGFAPSNLAIYRLATLHSSKAKDVDGFRESNERLEYLGDAILGAAVADYLFKKYPFKDEGFLTEIRSRIVNRESLNNLARKIGIGAIVQYDNRNTQLQKVILGNTLEALVGAVYLDKGYLRCKKFVIDKLIQPYFDLEVVVNSDTNHKSKVIEWAQRNSKEIKFEINETKRGRVREFSAQVIIEGESFGVGYGHTKKKAEQDASEKTCVMLSI